MISRTKFPFLLNKKSHHFISKALLSSSFFHPWTWLRQHQDMYCIVLFSVFHQGRDIDGAVMSSSQSFRREVVLLCTVLSNLFLPFFPLLPLFLSQLYLKTDFFPRNFFSSSLSLLVFSEFHDLSSKTRACKKKNVLLWSLTISFRFRLIYKHFTLEPHCWGFSISL